MINDSFWGTLHSRVWNIFMCGPPQVCRLLPFSLIVLQVFIMGLQAAAKVVQTTQRVPRASKGGCSLRKVIQALKVSPGPKSSMNVPTNTSNSQRPITMETDIAMTDEKSATSMDASFSMLELQPLMGLACSRRRPSLWSLVPWAPSRYSKTNTNLGNLLQSQQSQ